MRRRLAAVASCSPRFVLPPRARSPAPRRWASRRHDRARRLPRPHTPFGRHRAPSTRWPPRPPAPACSSSSSPTTATPRGSPIRRPTGRASSASTPSRSARPAATTRPSDSGAHPTRSAGEPRDVVEDVRRLGGFGIVTHPLSAESRPGLARLGRAVRRHRVAERRQRVARRSRGPARARRVDLPVPPRRVHRAALPAAGGTLAVGRHGSRAPRHRTRRDRCPRPARIQRRPRAVREPGLRQGPVLRGRVRSGVAPRRPRPARLAGDAAADAAAIVGAIRTGRVHTVVDGLGSEAAFDFTAASGGVDGGRRRAGARCPTRPSSGSGATRRPGGWVVLFRNGMQVHRVQDQELVYASDQAGTYRAEVWAPAIGRRAYVPWIVGNPIVVGPVEAPPAAPRSRLSGPTFWIEAADQAWGVEHDPRSRAQVVRDGGVGLSYALAPASDTAPYAALLATTSIDPSGRPASRSSAGRTVPMRVSVQVRVPAAGEGLRWHRSVYLDERPARGCHPVCRDDSAGRVAQGPPRVGDVRTLLFVVDLVNAKPGASGRFSARRRAVLRARDPGPRRPANPLQVNALSAGR